MLVEEMATEDTAAWRPEGYEASAPMAQRWRRWLQRIVQAPQMHARWLNTLSHLEYIGCRKMLKALPAATLDLAMLQHIREEAGHAQRFKQLSCSLWPGGCPTFEDAHLLQGNDAKHYFQRLDQGVAALLPHRPSAVYAWVTCLVEWRATQVYGVYEEVLQASRLTLSLRSILSEETRHLQQVQAAMAAEDAHWQRLAPQMVALESGLALAWLEALERSADLIGAPGTGN